MAALADKLGADLLKIVAKAVKTLEFELVANLVEATPVDTGWARANWVGSVGAPFDGVDGEPAKHGEATTAGELQKTGQAAVLAYGVAQGDVYVSNNVPYINRLDLGSSTQAPAGFVETAISEALATVSSRFAGLTFEAAASDLFDAGARGAAGLAASHSPMGGDE